jgi:hypothetical protein
MICYILIVHFLWLQLTGDVRVTFNEGGTRLFYLWFNTAYVTSGLLQFGKDELDKKRGKVYGPNFAVEVRPSIAAKRSRHSRF